MLLFYVSIICFSCAKFMVICDKFVKNKNIYIFTCRNPEETPMAHRLEFVFLTAFSARKMLNRGGLYFL